MFWLSDRLEERLRKKMESFYAMSFCSRCDLLFPMADFVVVPRCPHCKDDRQTTVFYTEEEMVKVLPRHFNKLTRINSDFIRRITSDPIELMKLRLSAQRSMDELLEDYLFELLTTPGEWVLKTAKEEEE